MSAEPAQTSNVLEPNPLPVTIIMLAITFHWFVSAAEYHVFRAAVKRRLWSLGSFGKNLQNYSPQLSTLLYNNSVIIILIVWPSQPR
jgi:hypothetical protein